MIQEERKMQQMRRAKRRERKETEPVISTHFTTTPSAGRTTRKRPGEWGVRGL